MHVKIGKPPRWIGPYQIADAVFLWPERVYSDDQETWRHRWSYRLGTWLAETSSGERTRLHKLCEWIYNKRERQVYVRLEPHDTWGMDHTLALVVVPMLEQLKATKHGAPHVDDEDVPEHLRSTAAEPVTKDYDVDSNHFLRWDWVLDEMIWAFREKSRDNADAQFFDHSAVDHTADVSTQVKQLVYDIEGHGAYLRRMRNGFRLFGKYYECLWD